MSCFTPLTPNENSDIVPKILSGSKNFLKDSLSDVKKRNCSAMTILTSKRGETPASYAALRIVSLSFVRAVARVPHSLLSAHANETFGKIFFRTSFTLSRKANCISETTFTDSSFERPSEDDELAFSKKAFLSSIEPRTVNRSNFIPKNTTIKRTPIAADKETPTSKIKENRFSWRVVYTRVLIRE